MGDEMDDKDLEPFFERLKAIPEFEDRGIYHYGNCPCGGTIVAIRSTYNGHLHVRCEKCGFELHQ